MSNEIVLNKKMLEGLSKSALLEIMLTTQSLQFSKTTPLQEAVKPVKSQRRPRWTPKQDAELLANLALGFTVTELADLHGRTYGSISARLFRLSQPSKNSRRKSRHKWTPEQDEALIADLAKGYSISAHAKRAGRTYGSVSKRLDRLRKAGKTQLGGQL